MKITKIPSWIWQRVTNLSVYGFEGWWSVILMHTMLMLKINELRKCTINGGEISKWISIMNLLLYLKKNHVYLITDVLGYVLDYVLDIYCGNCWIDWILTMVILCLCLVFVETCFLSTVWSVFVPFVAVLINCLNIPQRIISIVL